eukprot:6196506-Pleurochrysis_carterae.AAC.1
MALAVTGDPVMAAYAGGLVASFAVSHVDFIHRNAGRLFPRSYPYLNVCLPFGRCVFSLLILERLC